MNPNLRTPTPAPANRPTQRQAARFQHWVARNLMTHRSSATAHRRIMLLLVAATVLTNTLTGVAAADTGDPSALGPFDQEDTRGIAISQYQLSIGTGGLKDPIKATTAFFEFAVWSTWQYSIAFIAWLVDWVLGMEWITWISGPMDTLQDDLHTQVLEPLHLTSNNTDGLMGLFFVIAATVGGFHLYRGRRGRAVGEWLASALAAVLAVGILAYPVTLFLGDSTSPARPLRIAQSVGLDLANLTAGGELSSNVIPSGPTTPPPGGTVPIPPENVEPPEAPKFGRLLLDAFIRPVHQQLNYGTVIDTDHRECVAAYDKALKQGPYDADAKEQRNALEDCADGKLTEYAENTHLLPLIGLINTFVIVGLLMMAVLLVFSALIMLAVVMLGWATIKTVIHAPLAILPGDTKTPLMRDLIDVLISLAYLVTGIPLLAFLIQMMKRSLSATGGVPLQARFTGVGLIMLCSVIILISHYIANRRGGRSILKRIREALKIPNRQTVGDRVRSWAAQPSAGAAMAHPATSAPATWAAATGRSHLSNPTHSMAVARSAAATRLTRTGSTAGRAAALLGSPARSVLTTNGAQLALTAAGIATGGAGLVARGVAKTATKAAVSGYRASKTAPQATRKAIIATRKAPTEVANNAARASQTYKAFRKRGGSIHATTGDPHRDRVLRRTAQAHNLVARRTSQLINTNTATRIRDNTATTTGLIKDHLVAATGKRPAPTQADHQLRRAARDMSRPARVQAANDLRRSETTHLTATRKVERTRRKADRAQRLVNEGFYKPARSEAAQQRLRQARLAEQQAATRTQQARERAAQAKNLIRSRAAQQEARSKQ